MRPTHTLICSVMAVTCTCPAARPLDDATPIPPQDPAAEQDLLLRGGGDLRIERTDHFLIAYDAADRDMRRLLSRLRATHRHIYRFCKINDLPAEPLQQRLNVLFFNTRRQYQDYAAKEGFARSESVGFFSQRSNVSAFYNLADSPMLRAINQPIDQLDRQIQALQEKRPPDRSRIRKLRRQRQELVNVRARTVERLNRLTIQHEAAHQILFNAGIHVRGAQNPGWLTEGLACLFETPPSASGSGAGATNQLRLADVRACCGASGDLDRLRAQDMQVALTSKKFLPLRELIGRANLFDDGQDPNLVHYYSQAWSLVCYLQRNRRPQFAQYLRRLAQRRPGQQITPQAEIADFEAAFGPLDQRMQDRWARFVLERLQFKPSQLK